MSSFVTRRVVAFSRQAKRSVLVFAAVVAPITATMVAPVSVGAAPAPKPATDLFQGTATTGQAGGLPVTLDFSNIGAGPNGSLSVPYTYGAQGSATGDVKGTFTYEEHGFIYLAPDFSAAVGSSFQNAAFTVVPDKKGIPTFTVADTNAQAYQSGVSTTKVSDLATTQNRVNGAVRHLADVKASHGVLTYGWFTFTDTYGTFTGISTPDSHQFAINVTFDAPARDKDL